MSQFDDHVYDKTGTGKQQRNMEFSQDGVYNNPGDILGVHAYIHSAASS